MPTYSKAEGYRVGTHYAGGFGPVEDPQAVWAAHGQPATAPRRVVLLGPDGTVASVLAEWRGVAVSGYAADGRARREAAARPGRGVAVEWLSRHLGWVRFLEVTI